MSSTDKNLSIIEGDLNFDASEMSIGIVVSDWNSKVTHSLRDACIDTLTKSGCQTSNIEVVSVPGAFELPLGARLLSGKSSFDALICLGCVITGETKHDEYICNAVASGIMQLNVASGKPVVFGLLTPKTMQQALDRSGGKHGNKGVEAAVTALQMVQLSNSLKGGKKIGY